MKSYQIAAILIVILGVLVIGAVVAAVIYLFTLIVKAIKKYINSAEGREEKNIIRRSLGERTESTASAMQDDTGICGRCAGGQPSGGLQMGKWDRRPQYLQSAVTG